MIGDVFLFFYSLKPGTSEGAVNLHFCEPSLLIISIISISKVCLECREEIIFS